MTVSVVGTWPRTTHSGNASSVDGIRPGRRAHHQPGPADASPGITITNIAVRPMPRLDAQPRNRVARYALAGPHTEMAHIRWRASARPGETGAPAALVGLATPPPVPRPPSPPTLERLRRGNTVITTNYSRRK
jgi:hypothetical protein